MLGYGTPWEMALAWFGYLKIDPELVHRARALVMATCSAYRIKWLPRLIAIDFSSSGKHLGPEILLVLE